MEKPSQNRDLIREYISYVRVEKGLAKNSLGAYERDLRKLEVWCQKNGFELLTLTRLDLREWLMDLSRAKISENSKRRLISSIRGFYKFLMIDGHLDKSPAEDLDTPKKSLYLPKFLNQAEIDQLLSAPDVTTESGLRDRALLILRLRMQTSMAASSPAPEKAVKHGVFRSAQARSSG